MSMKTQTGTLRPMSPLIALMTDFGLSDPYVGVMKGIIASHCPGATCIDLTHDIRPQNIRQAAYLLQSAYRYFPTHTVFLVVVDPGVGTDRRPVAIGTDRGIFVGPDNGVFSHVLAEVDSWQGIVLNLPDTITPSTTFHGRDVFAPAAAALACGARLRDLGTPTNQLLQLPIPRLFTDATHLRGEVIHIDHFGNLVTNLGAFRWQDDNLLILDTSESDMLTIDPSAMRIRIGGNEINGLSRTYAVAAPGTLLSVISSHQHLEIAVNMGNAMQALGVSIGEPVEVTLG